MTKRATAADVLLGAAEMVQNPNMPYLYAVDVAVENAKASVSVWDEADNAAKLCSNGNMAAESPELRVLALLFARELVLSEDV